MNDFVVFSDLHLHNWQYGATYDSEGMNSRLKSQYNSMKKMLLYCRDNGIRLALFCGDFFHTHHNLHAAVLNTGANLLSNFKISDINIVMIPGNHDFADKSFINTLAPFQYYPDVFVYNIGTQIRLQGNYILTIPYTSNQQLLKDTLSCLRPENLFIAHAGIKNIAINSKGFILKDDILDPDWIPEVRYGFIGHYHSHKKIKDRIYIPGSTMQHTWADVGERRGFLHVTENFVKHIPLNAPEFIKITEDEIKTENVEGNFVKIINCPPDPDMALELRDRGALSVEFEIKNKIKSEIVPVTSDDFIVKDLFVQYINSLNLEENIKNFGMSILNETT